MPAKIIGSALPDYHGQKALTVDQFFDYLQSLTDEPTKSKLYAAVSWVYRCIELRANNLSAIPWTVMRGETELEDYPIDFDPLLWALEADLCIFGAGYWLKDRPRLVQELQRLNPSTMRIKRDKQDPRKGIVGFEQSIGGETYQFKPEQMVYFRYYSPDDDLGPGVPPLQVALQAADLARNANAWASQFFSHGAIPAVILHTEQMIPDSELERVRGAWNRLTQGVERAWRTLVLRQGLKPEVIGQPVKDLAMTELYESMRSQIAVAFGVPQTMLSDAANYATAKEHRLSFYQDTIIPRAKQIESDINDQMMDALGLEFVFHYNEIEAIQKDEAEKADYVRLLVEAKIITKDEAREMLGYEPIGPEQEDELRPPAPTFEPKDTPKEEPEEEKPVPPQMAEAATRALTLAMETDLKNWERKALSKGAGVPFESEFIPADLAAAIRRRLERAESDNEIKAAFVFGMPIASAEEAKAHHPRRVVMKCPVCGFDEADQYDDHGGLCVCANEECGVTFDPMVMA